MWCPECGQEMESMLIFDPFEEDYEVKFWCAEGHTYFVHIHKRDLMNYTKEYNIIFN
jgi:hypothetical protein